jgi:osmotically-inducible protein OsmY
MIRGLLLLVIVCVVGVAAWTYWPDSGRLSPNTAALDAETAKQEAARLARQAATKANEAAGKLGDSVSDTVAEGRLTAKIKSKMALDDHISARAIDVDTSGSIVTLTGVVTSVDERDRALRLARDTEGVTNVVDRLRIGNRP